MSLEEKQKALFTRLDEIGVATKTIKHKPVFTVEETKELKSLIPGGHCKNLFLKARKGQLYLIVALGDTPINLNKLAKHISEHRLSFGNETLLLEKLGVAPGSVTPFSLMNDLECEVKVILDKLMFNENILNFHPLLNNASTSIKPDDLVKFIKSCGHNPRVLSLDIS